MLSFEKLSETIAEQQLKREGKNHHPQKVPTISGVYDTQSIPTRAQITPNRLHTFADHTQLQKRFTATPPPSGTSTIAPISTLTPAPTAYNWVEFSTPSVTTSADPVPAPCYRQDYMPLMTRRRRGCNNIAEVDMSTLLFFPNQNPNMQFTTDLAQFNAASAPLTN